MTRRSAVLLLACVASGASLVAAPTTSSPPSSPAVLRVGAALPSREVVAPAALRFERNDGQTAAVARFIARSSAGTVFVEDGGATVVPRGGGSPMRMRFDGATAREVAGEARLEGCVHSLRGNDPSKWRTDIPIFGRAVCRDVWPGIDVAFHGEARSVEYDFEVAPGADPRAIALRFPGADAVVVDAGGDLVVHAGDAAFRHMRPRVFEEADGERREIPGAFAARADGCVGFVVPGHDATRKLIIDPVIAYATYVGGNDTESALDVAVDAAGNLYITGSVASSDYPLANPLPGIPDGAGADAYVTKLNASGSRFLYSTYIGGGGTDTGWGVRADASGIWLAGSTTSQDFPIVAALQPTYAGGAPEGDAFVLKLAAAGSSFVYSTFLGGSGDDTCRGLAVDAFGNVFLGGITSSVDFPTTAGAAQSARNGLSDAWAARLDRFGAALVWSTYLGGSSDTDVVDDVAVDALTNLFVAGYTASTDFPAAGGFQTTHRGGRFDGIVVKYGPSGALLASTLLGGVSDEGCRRVAVDAGGNACVAGFTLSENFPTKDAYQRFLRGGSGSGDGFVAKLEPGLAALVFSTYFGGSDDDDVHGLALASDGSVLIAGNTLSSNLPVASPVVETYGGNRDAFAAKLSISGGELVWSTYLGGPGYDAGTALAVDALDGAYVAASTANDDLPTFCGVQASPGGGPQDCYVVRLTESESGPPGTPLGVTAVALTPYSVDVQWTDVSLNECNFRVERRVETGAFAAVAAPDTDVASYHDASLEPDRTYAYRVSAENPLGASLVSDEALVTTPQTIVLSQREGGLVDSRKPLHDTLRVFALLRITGNSADSKLHPASEPFSLRIGIEANPIVVEIPSGDPGWKERRGDRWTWKSPKKARPAIRVDLDLQEGSMNVAVSKFDFVAPADGAVFLSVRGGDDAGHTTRAWTPKKKPGRFQLP